MTPLPQGPFGCIVADPPWRYSNTASRAAAENHYPTMSYDDLSRGPVSSVAAPNGHLYMWTTAAHIGEAKDLMATWGFVYKLNIVWVKTKDVDAEEPKVTIGLGNYYRHAHELCLFGVRGKAPALVHNLSTVIYAPRGRHSAKPSELQRRAELLSPGPYLELFARQRRDGWASWGNEIKEAA